MFICIFVLLLKFTFVSCGRHIILFCLPYYTVYKLLLKFTLVLCELSGLNLVLHIICPAFNVCPLYEWAVRAKTLFCKIFALLLTFALVSCELCEPYFVYIIRRSKLFAPLCGPRGL